MGAIVAVLDKKGQSAARTAIAMLQTFKNRGIETYGLASSENVLTRKSWEDMDESTIASSAVLGHAFSKILEQDKPQPLKLQRMALVFDGRIYSSGGEDSASLFAKRISTEGKKAAGKFVKDSEGDFAFVLAEPKKLFAGRDAIGSRPLYYGENKELAALASERKALWRIGLKQVESFPPGHIAHVNEKGFRFTLVKKLHRVKPRQTTKWTAAKKLRVMLELSVKERVSGLKKVAVAFSGGLDSSIIASLTKNLPVDVHLIHVSMENQPDTQYALRAAEELRIPICFQTYTEKDVERDLVPVLQAIEEPDPIQLAIGIPVFWAAEKAAERDCNVMLAGQGADEFFGGYRRYVDEYLHFGKKKVQDTIFKDISGVYASNLERDWKICNFHNVELRLPFAKHDIARFALGLPLEFKIEPSETTLRKLVLRQVAKDIGLPEFVVNKPKKAMQYTTGVNAVLRKLAKQNGLPVKEFVKESFAKIWKR